METKVSEEMVKVLDGLKSEIAAVGCLKPLTDSDRGYNEGLQKALSIVASYKEGRGLFQKPLKDMKITLKIGDD